MKDIAIPYSNLQNTVILWHGTYLLYPGCPLRTTHYSTYSHYSWYTRGSRVIHLHGWHGTFLICDVVCSYMWRDSFVCVTLVHMCESHSYEWGIYMNEVFIWMRHPYKSGCTHMNKSSTHTHTHAHECVTLQIWRRYLYDAYVWCDSVVRVTRHTFKAFQVTPHIWMGYPYE